MRYGLQVGGLLMAIAMISCDNADPQAGGCTAATGHYYCCR